MTTATATKGRKTKAKKTVVKRSRPLLTADELKAEEAAYVEAGYKIVKGTLRNRGEDPKKEERFKAKRSVEVKCETRGCGTVYRVATSDLHQKLFCDECTLEQRAERKNAARRAKNAKKARKRSPK